MSVAAPKPNPEETILAAAQEVFVEKGLAGARMQEIADRAGMNKALLHYYFRSKEKLFELVVGQAIKVLIPRLISVLSTDQDLFDKIRLLTGEYVEFLSRHSFLPVFIVNEINRNPQFFFKDTVQRERSHLDGFFRQVEEAVQQGRIRPISPHQLFTNMISLVVFPFLARPVLHEALQLDAAGYQALIEQRRTDVAEFIIQSLRP